jgi:prepilin-type N-terminal cleavage/methylation domain-containing protein
MQRDPDSGFTLIEVLVALAVAAAILSLCFELFSSNAAALGRTERAEQAVLLAESTLERATAEPGGVMAGSSGEVDGFTWRIDSLPFAAASPGNPDAPGLYQLRATVTWGSGAARRSYSLVTLRLAPASDDALGDAQRDAP